MTKLIVTFRNFANPPKNSNLDHRLTTAFTTRSRGREKKCLLVNTVSATWHRDVYLNIVRRRFKCSMTWLHSPVVGTPASNLGSTGFIYETDNRLFWWDVPIIFSIFSRHILEEYLKLGHRSFLPNPYPHTTPSAFAILTKPVIFKAINVCGFLVNKSEFSRKFSEDKLEYLGSQMNSTPSPSQA